VLCGGWAPCTAAAGAPETPQADGWVQLAAARRGARPGWAAVAREGTALPSASFLGYTDAELDADLHGFAAAMLPRPEERDRKASFLAGIEAVAQDVIGADVRVFGFGASLNGCGASAPDVDAVLYVPMTSARAANVARCGSRFGSQCLRKVAAACNAKGLQIGDTRRFRGARIVRLEEHAHVQTHDLRWQRWTLTACNLCSQALLPLCSTRLLREYVRLEPSVRTLVMVVTSWAEGAGMANSFEGFLSPFSWALLVVYYLQVSHGLPSLHGLSSSSEALCCGQYEVRFANATEARKAWSGLGTSSSAALLKGFFAFFSEAFEWETEVVSVRLGRRYSLDSVHLLRLGCMERRSVGLNIEHPIEVNRNLNAALDAARAARLRHAMSSAVALLEEGQGLAALLQLEELSLPCMELGHGQSLEQAYMDLPDIAYDSQTCACDVCGQRFAGSLALMQHQVDRGHLSAKSSDELERLQDNDAAAVDKAARRLQAALASGCDTLS